MNYRDILFGMSCLSFVAAGGSPPVDPGPRIDLPPHAGGPLTTLTNEELQSFVDGKEIFKEFDAVANGLGPRFNATSCGSCHAFPDTGGSSPTVNPQIGEATQLGARNVIPPFIKSNGPVREARFIYTYNGKKDKKPTDLDGGVHDIFVISGRSDAGSCSISQPDFTLETGRNNVVFRIPTPTFGLGLVENVPDDVLRNNAVVDDKLGIFPHFNKSGNDGTITKFGWKAQVKSLLIFSGEAYNVEQGVTNLLFPNERETDANCQLNQTPEDKENDILAFSNFMRFSAPPTPFPLTTSAVRGKTLFTNARCDACHVVSQTTHDGIQFNPYSDFALHAMGDLLADGILQGNAGPDEFRTAPLWGLSQRLFLLHDGRTSDLLQAILLHESKDSQANAVIKNFRGLSQADQQTVLDFLRSL